VGVGPPVKDTVALNVMAWPTVGVPLVVNTTVGVALLIVKEKVLDTFADTELVALIVTLPLKGARGVPLITPVDALSPMPVGRVPAVSV
jgi:hypothetical protein